MVADSKMGSGNPAAPKIAELESAGSPCRSVFFESRIRFYVSLAPWSGDREVAQVKEPDPIGHEFGAGLNIVIEDHSSYLLIG